MKKVEFKLPAGFQIPEGKKAGDDFESMAMFEIKENGEVCLAKIGDVPMPGYDDAEEKSEPDETPQDAEAPQPNSSQFASSMTSQMQQAGYS